MTSTTTTPTTTTTATPAQALLGSVLSGLDGRGIAAALVRPARRDGAGRLEADLLVARRDRWAVEAHLAVEGFRRRPGWGRRPHRFHVRPVIDEGSDTVDWLKIDLVTELRFGRWHELPGRSGSGCLGARSRGDSAAHRLAPADEFAALLLHALLDGERVREDQRRDLVQLAPLAIRPGPLARRCAPEGASTPNWPDLVEAVLAQDWTTVDDAAPVLRARLAHGHATTTTARRAANRLVRRSSKVLTAVAAPGPLVAVVGPDGTGKSTLTASLAESSGLPGRVLYGGTYPTGTVTSAVPGLSTARVTGRLLRTRAAAAWHRRRGRLVVLDRHPLQVRPGPLDVLSTRARARRRLLSVTLPDPDLVLVLDAPAEMLHRRRPEHSPDHLQRDRERHLALVGTGGGTLLDATRTPETVRAHAVSLVWDQALAPARPRPGPGRP